MDDRHVTDRERELLKSMGVTADELAAALRSASPTVPRQMERSILAAARARAEAIAAPPPRALRIRRPAAAALAAAAALVLAVGLWPYSQGQDGGAGRAREAHRVADATAHADAMDIDSSGAVDIVDAYLMSRRIDAGVDAPQSWDFDGSGSVDGADVEAVAIAAVSL
jgi:hypothetical protein